MTRIAKNTQRKSTTQSDVKETRETTRNLQRYFKIVEAEAEAVNSQICLLEAEAMRSKNLPLLHL